MTDWFTVEAIDNDTFAISEYKHWEETHCYLLCGTEKAILIDTGLGVANICGGLIAEITWKAGKYSFFGLLIKWFHFDILVLIKICEIGCR